MNSNSLAVCKLVKILGHDRLSCTCSWPGLASWENQVVEVAEKARKEIPEFRFSNNELFTKVTSGVCLMLLSEFRSFLQHHIWITDGYLKVGGHNNGISYIIIEPTTEEIGEASDMAGWLNNQEIPAMVLPRKE